MKRLLLALALMLASAAAAVWVHPPLHSHAELWLAKVVAAPSPHASPETTGKKAAEGPTSEARGKGGRGGGTPPVVAATVVLADMPVILSAPGTVEARATVTVRPRVDGQIAEVLFKEGDLVKAGQLLFRLDDRLVRAQIAQAEATIKRDEAQLSDAQGIYERRSTLVQKRIVSESAMDTAKANMEALKASIAAGKAALEAQRTQLDYLTIAAPITGRTGATTFKPGANVRAADPQPLVIINQTQPVNVVFALPQTDLVALRRALDAKAGATIRIPGGSPVTRQGNLDFLDNQVDRQTGTVTAKVVAANADELLWPGLAVEVQLEVERVAETASVPVSAVLPAQQGMIVWIIGADGKVSPRTVTLARIVGQTAFLADGVKGGERVVVDGHGRIAPGMTVNVVDPAAGAQSKGGARKGDKAGKAGEKGGDKAEGRQGADGASGEKLGP